MQSAVLELDPLQLASAQPSSEPLQPAVEIGRLPRQPLLSRCWQAKRLRGGRNGGGRQEIAVEPPIAGRTLDPDVAGAQLITEARQHGRLVEAPIRDSPLHDQTPPLLAERHWRIPRD